MWIPKLPKRHDFCGRPPCPICYVWTGDNGIREGVDKMLDDMLPGTVPTLEQRKAVEEAAKRIHDDNIARQAIPEPKPTLDGGAAAYDEAQQARMLSMQLKGVAAARKKAAEAKPIARQRMLDDLTDQELKALDEKIAAKKNVLFPDDLRKSLLATGGFDYNLKVDYGDFRQQPSIPVPGPSISMPQQAWSVNLFDGCRLTAYKDETLILQTGLQQIRFVSAIDAVNYILCYSQQLLAKRMNPTAMNKLLSTLESIKRAEIERQKKAAEAAMNRVFDPIRR